MVSPVSISHDSVKTQLVLHGQVVVFRREKRETGEAAWTHPDGSTAQQRVRVTHEATVAADDLSPLTTYTSDSGFTTTEAWASKITAQYNTEAVPPAGHIYQVRFP